jgi:hypothetical protein
MQRTPLSGTRFGASTHGSSTLQALLVLLGEPARQRKTAGACHNN